MAGSSPSGLLSASSLALRAGSMEHGRTSQSPLAHCSRLLTLCFTPPMKKLPLLLSALLLSMSGLRAGTVDVKVDATKTGAPINPYIYGQFIEHLGRCIYGGIWAEMLEDRKFYFPITAKYAPYKGIENRDFPGQVGHDSDYPVVGGSPWEIIGDPAAVTMVKEGAFVGDHSPRVNAG